MVMGVRKASADELSDEHQPSEKESLGSSFLYRGLGGKVSLSSKDAHFFRAHHSSETEEQEEREGVASWP